MKLKELQEAQHVSNQKEQWFIFDRADMDYSRLVGPFRSVDEAEHFMTHMKKKYGHMNDGNVPTAFNMELHKLRTPTEYDDEIKQHHEWLND